MVWILAWGEAILTDRPTDDGLLFLFNKTLARKICGLASQELLCLENYGKFDRVEVICM
jgi:hypothetical protein